MIEWLLPVVGVSAGALGVAATHYAIRRKQGPSTAAAPAAPGLHELFDKHAPAWRTCTCESCASRRDQANVDHPAKVTA